ncbi:MAG TPA: hypothetical protein VGE77_01890 [Nocardioides sp.]
MLLDHVNADPRLTGTVVPPEEDSASPILATPVVATGAPLAGRGSWFSIAAYSAFKNAVG